MLTDTLASVFEEPACPTNRAKSAAEKKKGCSVKALTPGAAAGGCAFDGAKIALQPIVDAIHLVHAPIACEGNGWDNRHAFSSGPQLYRLGVTTDLTDLDVIHGGEQKLYKAIRQVIERHSPAAVFVYQTCVPALAGDDVEAVCKAAALKFGTPVIPVNAPGMVGTKNLGNRLGGETLLKHVIGTMEPEVSTDADINIIGDYNLAGELWQVKPLLEAIGLRVQACITGDARYRDVAGAHRARVNMMVCSQAMINVARTMEERWGIPWFEGSFYGIADTTNAIVTMARLCVERGADPALLTRAEAVTAEGAARAWRRLGPYLPRLTGKKALVYTGGHKSWSMVSAVQELGMEVVKTSVRKATAEDKERVIDLVGSDAMVDDIPAKEMFRMLSTGEADILMSGGRSQFVALKAKAPWIDVNQERHFAYAGYDGIVEFAHRVDLSIANPVWQAVRSPAPWDADWSDEGEA
ncbi:MAG: nitrogenase iron-molybdenum cofactor biosynthesis protein NifE [Alphaproteobacteria bacterium]|nr:nitrogenase iron-molybdenum cofactor biosynthesis protein NifE [Alphaproteobacteria bacterium]